MKYKYWNSLNSSFVFINNNVYFSLSNNYKLTVIIIFAPNLPVSKSGVYFGASSMDEQFHRSPAWAARQAARARRAAAATCGMAAGWRRHTRACLPHRAPLRRASKQSFSVQLPRLS